VKEKGAKSYITKHENQDKPDVVHDKAFLICTDEILPIAAMGQPDRLSNINRPFINNHDKLTV